ncbi:MAG: ROK family protein [Treponema sp.]|jgi:predicted NBD/HSP70 family sugar kinase|nr:ROK family protein [Treponema sp.]
MADFITGMDEESKLIRELSINSLRSVLKQLRSASRPELARLTGLDDSMIDEYITELCLEGEFIEDGLLGSEETGEQELFYRFNGEHKLVLAVCVLEKDRVLTAVSDLYGEYLERQEIEAHPETMSFFEELVEQYKMKYPAISLLAFGMAGFEIRNSGKLLSMNFPDLEWVPFRDHFMERYGLPSILENDVKAAVAGFYETRDYGEGKCVAAINVPKTHYPSAGICMDGKIYGGRDNAAGEVAFLDTEVKWHHFSQSDIDISKVHTSRLLTQIALPMIVFLNPDCLVLYGSALPDNTAEELRKGLLENMPREFLPEIVFIKDILNDFLDGLVHLALKVLEPKIYLGGEPAD